MNEWVRTSCRHFDVHILYIERLVGVSAMYVIMP